MVVIVNDSLQIIDNPMEENIVVRNRGGGCIVQNPPMFSADGKYIFVLCGCCISAYSIQTGEHSHDFVSENKEEFAYATTFKEYLFGVTPQGNLFIWNTSRDLPKKNVKLKLPENTSVSQLHPAAIQGKNFEYTFVVAVKQHDKRDLQLYQYSATGHLMTNLYARVDNKAQSVSVCDEFVAAIKKDRLNIVPFHNPQAKNSMLSGNGRTWMAVACSPSTGGVAAGDETGRILYWPNALRNARGVFHWHTLAVQAIVFSPSGSYMYSGGGEGVMVRWNVEAPSVRHFLPRLPASIVHLAVCEDNQYVAVATQDNGIQLVDSQNKVACVVQRLAWGVTPVPGQMLFPAGLNWDPRSRSMVLNGRPGHLQFFSTDDEKLLYNLDITAQNFLSQERTKQIINSEVTRVALSYDGKWLVTVETQGDQHACCDTQLKFWQYKFNARQFSLNTCVQQPHQSAITAVKFQPRLSSEMLASEECYLLVTAGRDTKFRLWHPSTSDSIFSEGLRWVCNSIGQYRGLTPECAGFSADGSVLGVAFGPCLTLWDSELCQLKTSLTRDSRPLRAMEFGSHECCHLVVTASDVEVCVWSVLTLTISWAVRVRVSVLCADPLSSYMAVFSPDSSVFVFTPASCTSVYEKRKLCRDGVTVLAAMFVPRPCKLLDIGFTWCSNSQLHFIDSKQELQYLELESEPERGPTVRRPLPSAMATPFTVVSAKQAINASQRHQDVSHDQLGTAGDAAVRKLLSCPASTMPHIHLFCRKFLKSLAVSRKSEENKLTKEREEGELEIKMEIDEENANDPLSAENYENLNEESIETTLFVQDQISSPTKNNDNDSSVRKKQRRKSMKDKNSPTARNSFSFDDLDKDWISALETS